SNLIHKHMNLHVALMGGFQGGDKCLADVVQIKNVDREGYAVFGIGNRRQHVWKSLLGADKRRNGVAADERRIMHRGFVVEYLLLLRRRHATERQELRR